MLFTDHQSLKYLNSQKAMNRMHARWFQFLQRFTFTIKHNSGESNKVADALSRREEILATMSSLEILKDNYENDEDFHEVWKKCTLQGSTADFFISEGFLFKGNRLCMLGLSLREKLIQELHVGELDGHLG